jgi:hypothetical protein
VFFAGAIIGVVKLSMAIRVGQDTIRGLGLSFSLRGYWLNNLKSYWGPCHWARAPNQRSSDRKAARRTI